MKTLSSKYAAAVTLLSLLESSQSFSSTTRKNRISSFSPLQNNIGQRKQTSFQLYSSTNDLDKLKAQAAQIKLEAEKMEAELNLQKIQKIESEFQTLDELKGKDLSKKQNELKKQIQALANRVDPSLLSSFDTLFNDKEEKSNVSEMQVQSSLDNSNSNSVDEERVTTQTNLYANRKIKATITEAELTSAVEYYTSLPKPMRQALAKSIDLDETMAAPAIIVLGLYELSDSLSTTKLQSLYQQELNPKELIVDMKSISDKNAVFGKPVLKEPDDPFNPFRQPDATNMEEINSMVENFLPRQTRKEGTVPTQPEVEVFTTQVLGKIGKDTWSQSGPPEKISGGYLIRGSMASKLKDDGDALIAKLDEAIEDLLPAAWSEKYQVSYMTDPTPQMLEFEEDLNGAAVLIVHSKDMSPEQNTLLSTGVSSISLFLAFVFAIGIFGQNDTIMQRLQSAQGQLDYDLTWFNQLVSPFLIAIGITQASHEVAHLAVAKKEGFKITPPTILPLISLPYMSFQNRIKTSPKNFSTLFNFAFIGPLAGMITSFVFLILGLQMTLEMNPDQVTYAPSIPVGFLQLSSLGANIVDYVLGGGDGLLLQQDPNTPVILHPFAIAGIAGLMINALDTIPLAATDGGRMSLALLGRPGHVAFSGLVYFAILLYTIFSGHQDIFLSYLFVTSFTQKDLEIPARNEVDQASLSQAAIALTMWCVAILTLTPTN
ncbi:hypothetical protein CTEN210_01035 [Chaetoceros tenuissimus]|uniref:Peptidase M50 domain-containing protein n=1 Tax=Chaetoceros tenuissimus TaxID=426638 RepID=A0AAD3CEY5_9STRA|nr:hypothetical protein CTEN210_01035 [Chaetoceros tenuissimus]